MSSQRKQHRNARPLYACFQSARRLAATLFAAALLRCSLSSASGPPSCGVTAHIVMYSFSGVPPRARIFNIPCGVRDRFPYGKSPRTKSLLRENLGGEGVPPRFHQNKGGKSARKRFCSKRLVHAGAQGCRWRFFLSRQPAWALRVFPAHGSWALIPPRQP